jgi:hypothetical protein
MPRRGADDLERFRQGMSSESIRGWRPVRVKKTRQIKNPGPRSDSIGKAPAGSTGADDARARAGKTCHQMPVMRDRFRPANQIALNLTSFPREERPLFLGFDALGDDRQSERAPKSQNRVDDGTGLKAAMRSLNAARFGRPVSWS